MADTKTTSTDASVEEFLDAVEHAGRREDGHALLQMMTDLTGQRAVMWGPSIVGFGRYHYKYASGHEGEAAAVGFSPRKANLVVYGLANSPAAAPLIKKLGKHKAGAACIYINRLADVDLAVLKQLITEGYRFMTTTNHVSQKAKR